MLELRIKFYVGQNEDCSLGDSTSDSSECGAAELFDVLWLVDI